MNITAIKTTNNQNNVYFSARLSEKEIVRQLGMLLSENTSPIVERNLGYLKDMKKGANISLDRKAQINEWIADNLFKVDSFFREQKEARTYREHVKRQEKHTIVEDLTKGVKKTAQSVIGFFSSTKKKPIPSPNYQNEPAEVSFFNKFRELFESYLDLKTKPAKNPKSEETLEEMLRTLDMEFLGISPQMQKEAEELTPVKQNLIINRQQVKPKAKPKSKAKGEASKAKATPEVSKIRTEKGGDPRAIIGISEEEAKKLRAEFEDYQTKYWDEEWYAVHKAEYRSLEAKIKKHNISMVDKKEFSENPLEQVAEKHEYIQKILGRAGYNEASYYDALLMFEKYGTREEYSNVGTSTLSQIRTAFPENPTEKTVNKVMDVFEKYGKFYMDGDELGKSDGLSYLTIMAKPDVIKTEEQLRRALEKGKDIIWDNAAIYDLGYTLMRAQNAPMKENQSVKNILEQFYKTAYDNRTPYKDHFDIEMMEKGWKIKRE